MIITQYDLGIALTQQKISNTGTTVFTSAPYCYRYTEHIFTFTGGGTLTPLVGNWIKGATTNCRARIVSIGTLDTGTTWAGGDAAGTMRICSMHGETTSATTYFDGTENVSIVGTADDLTMSSTALVQNDGYPYMDRMAKAALVTIYANTALVCWDGSIPDQNQLNGQPMDAGSFIILPNEEAIKNFKCLDYTNGSNSTVYITYFF